MADTRNDRTPLDLLPSAVVAPRLRALAVVAVLLGAGVGALVSLFLPWPVGVMLGLALGLPPAVNAYLAARRSYWLEGRRIHRRAWRTTSVDVAGLIQADIVVHPARFSHVSVRVADRDHTIVIPVALYATLRGRELDVLALRRLADALAASELMAAAAVARVLVGQLRAEARGAGVAERPLYRALELARTHRKAPQVALAEEELAALAQE